MASPRYDRDDCGACDGLGYKGGAECSECRGSGLMPVTLTPGQVASNYRGRVPRPDPACTVCGGSGLLALDEPGAYVHCTSCFP